MLADKVRARSRSLKSRNPGEGMPVPLFERKPEVCPYGHVLGRGQVHISWTPCICQPAREANKRGARPGAAAAELQRLRGRGTAFDLLRTTA